MNKSPFSQTDHTFWFFFGYIFWNRDNFFFLKMRFLCAFYSFYNKFACFAIGKNYFLFFVGFKRVDFLEAQPTNIDFYCPILFSNATPFMFLLSVFFSQTKQFFFFRYFGFSFDLRRYLSYSSIFLTYFFNKIF